jgi:hypothetical protein
MSIAKVVVNSTPAMIGIRTQNAKVDYETTRPMVEIEQKQAQIILESTPPKITIDQSQCFSESGLKSITELIRENSAYGVRKMLESVGRIAEQGNQLADIGRTATNAIPDQAAYNAYSQFDFDYNMGTMPMSRPKIELVEGKVNVSSTGGTVKITPRMGHINQSYTPGKVEIYLQQMNSINIHVEGENLDLKV